MKNNVMAGVAMAIGAGCLACPAGAASLQVSPVNLNVDAPAVATAMTLRNGGDQPFTAQVRVFRWVQRAGRDLLEPTDVVVASPPAMRLAPRQSFTVRVVRTAGAAPVAEEAYRVVVDELPPPSHKTRAVTMVARHVIPVFFTPGGASGPDVRWSLAGSGRGAVLQATNQGDSYLRLSGASLRDGAGRKTVISPGLVGYVLPGSTMRFPVRSAAKGLAGKVTLEARSQSGAINATLVHGPGR